MYEEDKAINAGERIDRFLADEAVIAAFAKMEQAIVEDWKRAASVELRESCWAKQQVVRDIMARLRAEVDAGKLAQSQKEQRIAREIATKRKGQ